MASSQNASQEIENLLAQHAMKYANMIFCCFNAYSCVIIALENFANYYCVYIYQFW